MSSTLDREMPIVLGIKVVVLDLLSKLPASHH